MTDFVTLAMSQSKLQKLKLQLFHRLQRRHRDAWKRYWGSFQLYLVAKVSLEEFHALAEELLGAHKHLHNEFVVALLSTAYRGDDELPMGPQPPSTYNCYNRTSSNGPQQHIILQEGAEYDFKQQQDAPHGCKRQHSSVALASEETAEHLDRDNDHDHTDHHSAQLLIDLYKHATPVGPSAIGITPGSTPSNSSNGFKSRVPMQDCKADSFAGGS